VITNIIIIHTHLFNGPLSRTTRVSRYQKGKTNLDFIGARDSEWQWHQLGHMQVCTSFQTENHASTPPHHFYRPDALPATQPTASMHRRHKHYNNSLIPNLNKAYTCTLTLRNKDRRAVYPFCLSRTDKRIDGLSDTT